MDIQNLAERIRQKRKSKGLTQAELAERLGLSEMTIRRWEASKRSPRMEEISELANVLETPVDFFVGNNISSNIEQTKKSSINNNVEPNDDLDLGYWGNMVERAKRAARSSDIEKISAVAMMLKLASNALNVNGVVVPSFVGMQGNIQGNNNNVKNNVAMAAAAATACGN